MIERVSIAEIKLLSHDSPFFSPGAMAFFASRLPKHGWRNGDAVWFYTSEQVPGGERRWTLRHLSARTGKIDTVGEFQQYATAAKARRAVEDAVHNNLG